MMLAAATLCALTAQTLITVEGESTSAELSGSAKLFPLFTLEPSTALTERDTVGVGFGSFRLNGLFSRGSLTLESAYHLFPVLGDGVGATEMTASVGLRGGLVAPIVSPLRVVDFDRDLVTVDDFVLLHNFDRISISYFGAGGLEVRVGRQAMNHGSSRLFPASDIYSPFSPATLDSEFKQGLDALRATYPLDESSEIELYAILVDRSVEDSLERGVYLIRYRRSFEQLLDLSVYTGTSYASPTLGVDVSGDIGGATVYAEVFLRSWNESTANTFASSAALLPDGEPVADTTLRATVGGQYFFPIDLDVIVELHWNSPGVSARERYLETTARPEWAIGELYLLGLAYLGTAWTFSSSDLTRVALSTITSLVDGSTLLTPSFFWDASEATSLSVGAVLGAGRRLDENAVADEFGLYPYTFFADARVYF